MAFSIVSRALLRTSREMMERNIYGGTLHLLNGFADVDHQASFARHLSCTPIVMSTANVDNSSNALLNATRQYKKQAHARKANEPDSDSDTDSDDEYERKRLSLHSKTGQRGDSEFWRRKMRTLHRILDVNRDGVVSFDDFHLLAKRFTDLGHLNPTLSNEFMSVMKETWEEQFGEMNSYNLVNAEQFLVDIHHRLNDNNLSKRIGRFLPYLFKAVDYDHSGYLDLDQYKLFFRCLGLSDEDAAISFAVIDKNGDGHLSLEEFVHLGRQYFLTEDESKISKMFWGPLIDH